MKRKADRDLANECRSVLFKIDKSLSVPEHRFKVDKNAQQFKLCGYCLIADQNMAPDLPNLVLIEGGP